MVDVKLSITEAMKDWIEAQTHSGRYGDAGDYMRDLIRHDQERTTAISALQKQIDEGLSSGVSDRSMDDVLESARRQAKMLEQRA